MTDRFEIRPTDRLMSISECLLIVTLLICTAIGCSHERSPLNGKWRVSKKLTLSSPALRQGRFESITAESTDWVTLEKRCFDFGERNQLVIFGDQFNRTVSAKRLEVEPNIWRVTIDSDEFLFNIEASVLDAQLRIVDAGYLFVLERKCEKE